MSARTEVMRVGAEPRAQLLPPQVRSRQKWRRLRGKANIVVVLALVVAIAASAGASVLAMQTQDELAQAQNNTSSLIAAQGRYRDVQQVQTDITALLAAQRVGAATEVDWQAYLSALDATLPARVAFTSITVQAASPLAAVPQSASALATARVAVLQLHVTGPDVPTLRSWFIALARLKGFAGLSVPQIADTDGGYTASVTLSVNADAYSQRFATTGGSTTGDHSPGGATTTEASSATEGGE